LLPVCGFSMKAFAAVLTFLVCAAIVSSDVVAAENESSDQTCPNNNNACGGASSPSISCNLYLAPSTIPNAGLGIFTTIPLTTGTVFAGDVVYPILKLETKQHRNPFVDYLWDAFTVGMTMETSSPEDICGLSPGFGAALNSNMALDNIRQGELEYDDQVGGHRSLSPSAGSMTPYYSSKSIVSHDIPAGGELFKRYGNQWFVSRSSDFGLLPLVEDYPKAERLLKRLRGLEYKLNMSAQARHDFYSMITNTQFESRIMNALPQDYMHVDTIVKKSMRAWHEQNATRSVQELRETGRCTDNIRHGESTIPYAGRGAFATRPIKSGDIITGSPLIHVPTLKMAVLKDDENSTAVPRYQIWLNYCMGHCNGDLLLCPYGLGVNYMNHNQTLANVKLQWSPDGLLLQNEMSFHKSTWGRYEVTKTHLAMDYVATHDIVEGEELFLDYGDEWEEAWQMHVANWKPTNKDRAYTSATQWNKEHADETIRTQEEQQYDPYPPNLLLHCSSLLFSSTYTPQKSKPQRQNIWKSNDKGNECQILGRVPGEDGAMPTYIVQVIDPEGKVNHTQHDIPRNFIRMVDAPYSTDWHRQDAFRHWIGIPDDMFPDAWKISK